MNPIRNLLARARTEFALFRESPEDAAWLTAMALTPLIALAVIFALFNQGTM